MHQFTEHRSQIIPIKKLTKRKGVSVPRRRFRMRREILTPERLKMRFGTTGPRALSRPTSKKATPRSPRRVPAAREKPHEPGHCLHCWPLRIFLLCPASLPPSRPRLREILFPPSPFAGEELLCCPDVITSYSSSSFAVP